MNRYRFNNNSSYFKNDNNSNGTFDQDEVANRFKDYVIKLFNINNETVTKLEKSRVKQIYLTQFKQECQSIIY